MTRRFVRTTPAALAASGRVRRGTRWPARRFVRTTPAVLAAVAAAASASGAAAARERPRPAETVVEIRVHGNVSVPDAEVRRLAGVAVGDAAGPDLADTVRRRLLASGRFETVEVRRRTRSLRATGPVAVVIVVRERPGAGWRNPVARALAAVGRRVMAAPVLEHEEGWGVAYGALTAVVDPFGRGSRLSAPATWGGHKRIALEMEAPLPRRVLDLLRAGGSRGRRRHPHFDVDDDRTRFHVAVERRLPGGFRLGAETAWEDVRFADEAGRLSRAGVTVDYGDYREKPIAARRDAVVVRAGIERLAPAGAAAVLRPRLDARAYAAAGGQATFAARFLFEGASGVLPRYEQALLGGSPAAGGTLRGWRAGAAAGDRIAAASVELRLPVTSLLSDGRVGLRFFYDTAAAYEAGRPLRRARFRKGAGAGLFFLPPRFGFPVSIDVAHDFAGGMRVHGSVGFGF